LKIDRPFAGSLKSARKRPPIDAVMSGGAVTDARTEIPSRCRVTVRTDASERPVPSASTTSSKATSEALGVNPFGSAGALIVASALIVEW
jgi:hypothetical protein